MRLSRKVSATMAGIATFIAQVSDRAPAVPNLRPAMKITFGHLGSCATASRSARSQAMVSTSQAFSLSATSGSEKRATPITRRSGAARLASRASVGPILPPTPRIRISPSTVARSRTSAADGRVMNSSSAASSANPAGRSKASGFAMDGFLPAARNRRADPAPRPGAWRHCGPASIVRYPESCHSRRALGIGWRGPA